MRFCKINAQGTAKIAEEMNTFNNQTLTHLNLSSNFLADEGARCIADSLRINRCLLFLNLADNQISDHGCIAIMQSLQKFPLKQNELILRRKKILSYYATKHEMVHLSLSI